jgi:hypothetical protein
MADLQTTVKRKRPLRRKFCAWCDQPLEKAAKGHCAAIYRSKDFTCFWVSAIRDLGAEGALEISRSRNRD